MKIGIQEMLPRQTSERVFPINYPRESSQRDSLGRFSQIASQDGILMKFPEKVSQERAPHPPTRLPTTSLSVAADVMVTIHSRSVGCEFGALFRAGPQVDAGSMYIQDSSLAQLGV